MLNTQSEQPTPIINFRRKTSKLPIYLFLALTLVISLGFFVEGSGATYISLSGDQVNILTICKKLDFPESLQGDLVAGRSESIRYYIPLFVKSVRLASLPDHNYIRGLNILLLATSVLYMMGWWLLFSTITNDWIATVLAFMCRAVLFLPGEELWGISGIWTMLPRTLFLALLPWVLWFWSTRRATLKGWLIAAFACGLIVNVHPISGACISVCLMLAEVTWSFVESRPLKVMATRVALGGTLIILGMLPYLITYLFAVPTVKANTKEFADALQMRMGTGLLYPSVFLKQWLSLRWATIILGPWLAVALLPKRAVEQYRPLIIACAAFAVGSAFTSLAPFAIERVLHHLGRESRFAFQLVRTFKFVLVPSLLLIAVAVQVIYVTWFEATNLRRRVAQAALIATVLLPLLAGAAIFDGAHILSSESVRSLWPGFINPGMRTPGQDPSLVPVMDWIRENTQPDDKFVGPRLIRVATGRSVLHDWLGAGMLVEGDPGKFVQAAARERLLRDPEFTAIQKAAKMHEWGASYWVNDQNCSGLSVAFSSGSWFVCRV